MTTDKAAVDLAEARRYASEIARDLAAIQDQLAGPRMARRAVRDRIAQACVQCEYDAETETGRVLSWRPPTPEEVAEIDAVMQRTASILRELAPVETALKHAKRVADQDVKNLLKGAKSPGKVRAKSVQKKCPDHLESPTGKGLSGHRTTPVQSPGEVRARTGLPLTADRGFQAPDLFNHKES